MININEKNTVVNDMLIISLDRNEEFIFELNGGENSNPFKFEDDIFVSLYDKTFKDRLKLKWFLIKKILRI